MYYRLVNNFDYGFKGVYYVGLSDKYHDIFNIGPKSISKIYIDLSDAIKDKDMLKHRFDVDFDIEKEC